MATKKNKKPAGGSALEPRFAAVVEAFADKPGVSFGGKGFGAKALKLDEKLFAMWTSKGFFCCKLPAARVDELVRQGHGDYFETGTRRMKEWLQLGEETVPWIALAQEALAFAKVSAR